MTTAFTELCGTQISVQKSCALTGMSRATYYRRANPPGARHGPWLPRRPSPAALTDAERARVTDLLTSPTYRDLAIPQVWARELDERSRQDGRDAAGPSVAATVTTKAWERSQFGGDRGRVLAALSTGTRSLTGKGGKTAG